MEAGERGVNDFPRRKWCLTTDRQIPFKARLHWYRYEDPQELPLLIAMLEHDSTGQHIDASRQRLAAYAKLSLRTVDYLLYGRPASRNGHKAKRGLIARAVVTEKNPANAKNRRQPAQYRINEEALELDPRMKPEWIKGHPQLPMFEAKPKKPFVPAIVSDDPPPAPRTTHAHCAGVDHELIRKCLAQIIENPDRIGTERLINGCVSKRPDVTTGEVTYWIAAKAAEMTPEIRSRMGFLISVVPECFAGEAFEEWRNLRAAVEAAKVKQAETQAAELVEARVWREANVVGECRGCRRPRFKSSTWSDYCSTTCRVAHEAKQ